MSGSLTEVADYTAQGRLTLRDELEQVLHQYFRMMKFLGKEKIVQWKLREEYRAEVAGWGAAIQEARGELPMSDRNLNRIAMNLAAEGFDTTEWEKVYAQEYDGYKQTLISLMGPAFAAVWTN